jgi:hypothetical protein
MHNLSTLVAGGIIISGMTKDDGKSPIAMPGMELINPE